MTKLKTLKDFKVGLYIADDGTIMASALKEGLRQEAIKWLKVYELLDKYNNSGDKTYMDQVLELLDVKEIDKSGLPWTKEKWIKHFFNITEKDLK